MLSFETEKPLLKLFPKSEFDYIYNYLCKIHTCVNFAYYQKRSLKIFIKTWCLRLRNFMLLMWIWNKRNNSPQQLIDKWQKVVFCLSMYCEYFVILLQSNFHFSPTIPMSHWGFICLLNNIGNSIEIGQNSPLLSFCSFPPFSPLLIFLLPFHFFLFTSMWTCIIQTHKLLKMQPQHRKIKYVLHLFIVE